MSIATEITRLQTAKADLKTAIEGKGVTVPSATKIDGYADLVDSIETGGGGGNDNFEDLVNGSLSGAVTITTATAIRDSVFLGSTLMTSISSNTATRIDNAAFYNCTRLQSASFPNVTSFGGNQNFHGCSLLSSIYFPKLSADIPNYAFRNCSALVNVALQKAVSFNTGVFQGCTALQSFDVGGNGGYFGTNTFNSTALNTLVIRSTSVKTLGNTNAFASTPFASGGTGGTLYVPSALVSSYQSASNWSTILGYANNSIQAIEGSYYETHYADGTVIS